ncbi:MAG: flavodoxin family protein [Eggerthellaceae bacterium]|nr:flavodoxin family protein [Eggerthellaceae bacterium]
MERRVIIIASPRRNGVSHAYARRLESFYRTAGYTVEVFDISTHIIAGCNGCAACEKSHTCVINDDMSEVYELLACVDGVDVVSPVYFAGPPSQYKALLDRLQPRYEARLGVYGKKDVDEVKRPVYLHVIGTGNDPHGFEPLVVVTRSAFGASGFYLAEVIDARSWHAGEMLPSMNERE